MSHDIDISRAREFIHNFQEENGEAVALLFNREKIEKILNQKDCEGLRIYLALKKDGEKTVIIVGHDGSDRDINADLSEFVAEYGIPDLDAGSPLLK
jgi:hypothetical protein